MEKDDSEQIQYGGLRFILKSRSLMFLVIYAILFFSLFSGFPQYAREIYGNQSLPLTVQTIFVYSPIGMWLVIGIILAISLVMDMVIYYREKMEYIKRDKNE